MNTILRKSLPALALAAIGLLGGLSFSTAAQAQPDPNWLAHDRDRPLPPVVKPGQCSTPDQPGQPPSDAIVLFDGKDLSPWVAMNGSPPAGLSRRRHGMRQRQRLHPHRAELRRLPTPRRVGGTQNPRAKARDAATAACSSAAAVTRSRFSIPIRTRPTPTVQPAPSTSNTRRS
jgi:hypothetical protein